MIPLLGISQVGYIIGKDSVVCYTHIENRRIATLLMEGEYYKTVAEVNDSIIANKDIIIDAFTGVIKNSDSLIVAQNKRLQELLIIANRNTNKLKRLDKSNIFWRSTAFISIAVCVPLILLK